MFSLRTHVDKSLNEWKEIGRTLTRLSKGSLVFAVLIVACAVGGALAVVLGMATSIQLIDELIGAKSLRAMTSDLEMGQLWRFIWIVVAMGAFAFYGVVKGLSREIFVTIFFAALAVLVFIFAVQASFVLMLLIGLVYVILDFIETRWIRMILFVAALLLLLPIHSALLDAAIFNRLSISEAMGLMLFSTLFIALMARKIFLTKE